MLSKITWAAKGQILERDLERAAAESVDSYSLSEERKTLSVILRKMTQR